jgi:hypothetical protein
MCRYQRHLPEGGVALNRKFLKWRCEVGGGRASKRELGPEGDPNTFTLGGGILPVLSVAVTEKKRKTWLTKKRTKWQRYCLIRIKNKQRHGCG